MIYNPELNHFPPLVLVMGNSGCGKTEAAKILAKELRGVHINGDDVRTSPISGNLGFGISDRYTHAERMGKIANIVIKSGIPAIVDFICPTKGTRQLFFENADISKCCSPFVVWMNTKQKGKYEDTNKMWEDPDEIFYEKSSPYAIEISSFVKDRKKFVERIGEVALYIKQMTPFQRFAQIALFLGRFQGAFHEGHIEIVRQALSKQKNVLILVRDVFDETSVNPEPYVLVKERIEKVLKEKFAKNLHRIMVAKAPDITNIVYGRTPGFNLDYVDLPKHIQQISASVFRKPSNV